MSGCSKNILPEGCISSSSQIAYDGQTFSCFKNMKTLNELLEAFGNKLCSSQPDAIPSDAVYSDSVYISGLNSFTLTQAIESINNQIQEIINDDTCNCEFAINDILIGDFSISNELKSCLGFGVGQNDNLGTLLTNILESICTLNDEVDVLQGNGVNVNQIVFDGGNIVSGADSGKLYSSASSLDISIKNPTSTYSKYMVGGSYVQVKDKTISLQANSDNYIEVTKSGDYYVIQVALGDPEPDPQTGNRIHKVTTNGSGVTSSTDLRVFKYIGGDILKNQSILTNHIADDAITSAKIESIHGSPSTTIGINSLLSVEFNDKGQVTDGESHFSFTGLAAGDLLKYDGTNWVNFPFTSGGTLPSGAGSSTIRFSGGTWLADTFLKNTGSAVSIGSTPSPVHPFHLSPSTYIASGIGAPSAFSVSAVSGGSLSVSTTYYYQISFLDYNNVDSYSVGNTSGATTGSNRAFNVSFTWPIGAKAVRIWRSTTSGTFTGYLQFSNTGQNTVSDTGGVLTSGTPATSDSSISNYFGSLGIHLGFGGVFSGKTISARTASINSPTLLYLENEINEPGSNLIGNEIKTFGANTNFSNISLLLKAEGATGTGKNIALLLTGGRIVFGSGASAAVSDNGEMESSSTNKAWIPPKMTTTQRDAVSWTANDEGAFIYNTTTGKHQSYDGNNWNDL